MRAGELALLETPGDERRLLAFRAAITAKARRGDDGVAIRVGFTVTKKIGNAVVRNRMKRRLRALSRAVLPERGVAGADHVLIGREGGIERDFASMIGELERALAKVAG